eukprot:562156-Prorocentrum_minimum.AAC.1
MIHHPLWNPSGSPPDPLRTPSGPLRTPSGPPPDPLRTRRSAESAGVGGGCRVALDTDIYGVCK